MTMAVPEQPGEVAERDFFEDVDQTDLSIPRLVIDHKQMAFRNRQTGELVTELDCILLSVVKQRAMWAGDPAEDGKGRPRCKSADHKFGFPNNDETRPIDERFPWNESNFDPANFPAESGTNGLVTLPCASCIFKEWDKAAADGSRKWKQPPCNEQHTYPLIYSTDGWQTSSPALISFARTGISPSKNYYSVFATSRTPMFQYFTKITLEQHRKGTVVWCTPKFVRGGPTDRDDWDRYGELYFGVRDLITRAPRNYAEVGEGDSDVVASGGNVNNGPTAEAPPAAQPQQPAQPAAPAAAPAAAQAAAAPSQAATPAATATATEDDEDFPF